MIYVIATSDVKAGMRDEFLKIFNTIVPIVRQEKGCLMYQPTVDFPSGISVQKECSDTLVTILECWDSLEDLQAHLNTEHMRKYREKTKDMVQSKTLNVVEPV